jgi:hypothetical protein
MTHARARIALLAIVVVGAAAAVVPSQASALVSFYNCVNKPPSLWCDGKANGTYDGQHSWDYNEVWSAVGSVNVCQGIYKPSSGNWLYGHSCAMDWDHFDYGNVQCACYEAEIAHTNGNPQTIYGFADTE